MNDYLLAVILGVVEGLTEFLPVSSTAHLRITQALVGVDLEDPYWKMFAVVIQLGAVLSLLFVFSGRIRKFVATFPRGEAGDRTALNHPLTLVLVAFVTTAVPAFLLSKVIHENLESLLVISAALIVGGVVMWVVDVACRRPTTDRMERMTLPQAVTIGAAQILSAVFPGTSRSMATIASGQLAGLSRPAALEFSFFVSIPVMLAATGYDLLKFVAADDPPASPAGAMIMNPHRWAVLGVGFVVSFVVAMGVVIWFMAWVRTRGFVPFAVYRILLGFGILVWALWS